MTDHRTAIIALRAVAALAEKLADDLDKRRLWEGDASSTLSEIRKHLAGISLR